MPATLDPRRYRIDVVACFRKPGMPDQTHRQLEALGVDVDRALRSVLRGHRRLSRAARSPAYDIVVSCQNVADIYPALERLHWRPPLIEHGGLVSEALAGPSTSPAAMSASAARSATPRPRRCPGGRRLRVEIPSMVDLDEFATERPRRRCAPPRASRQTMLLVGWVGRLDARSASRISSRPPRSSTAAAARRFLVIGGPDAFMPEYAERAAAARWRHGLSRHLTFLGDREDVPELLAAMDVFVWLSRGEGMPHVIAEAGAAALPVIATADNGSMQQIEHGVTGLFVPHESPRAVAAAIERLVGDPTLRYGSAARCAAKCETTYAPKSWCRNGGRCSRCAEREVAAPPPQRLQKLSSGRLRVLDA